MPDTHDVIREAVAAVVAEQLPAALASAARIAALSAREALTADEVQELYGLNSRTLANWRSQGRGPEFVKAGNVILYPRRAVDQWLARHQVRVAHGA